MKLFSTIIISIIAVFSACAQSGLDAFLKPSDTLNKKRRNAVVITEAALATTALVSLNQLWYADYKRTNFRTINDSNDWLQMDKLGHVFSAYQIGRLAANSFNWAGVSKRDQLIYGGMSGFGFLTAVEIMDGFSEEWGFSWADMASNAAGAGFYIGQELLWQEQRILIKYSFHRTSYAEQRPELLGKGLHEEFLKDYNGQSYWLSINLEAFLKTNSLPKWLNFAFGYSGDGMLTGDSYDPLFPDQKRVRQYFLSLDVDLSRLNTKSHFWRTIFDILNVIKVPFPAIEFTNNGAVKWHLLYF